MPDSRPEPRVEDFIKRWGDADGTERANYQLFLTELCALLDVPVPDPASRENTDNAYVFERSVDMRDAKGASSKGFIDLYRRGSFVCEAKQSGKSLESDAWDRAMIAARSQADNYVRSLPITEGRPPFILVVDVGRNIDLYAEFTRTGGTYTPYPDPKSYRIQLTDLRKPEVLDRLRAVWLDPLSLDPSRITAQVTREVADKLAALARSLEARGHSANLVAGFLMRALFTMFAEDVGLIPNDSFTDLLISLGDGDPRAFAPMLEDLWRTMNTGGFSPVLRQDLLRFNGGFFSQVSAIPLEKEEFELLLAAAKCDWRFVEPAIFGTLLERALDSRERHKLGAHYTPRAYVERLVFPTIIDPLRYEWENAKATAIALHDNKKHEEAIKTLRGFHQHLANIRVLDPACGSGNFLYVTLEHMKRLEGEVLNLLDQLGDKQAMLEMGGISVDPHQFLGMEINPRAAKIAELVLWIGYLQWHFRTHGKVAPPEPILRDFKNIENRDALIDYDSREVVVDESGAPVTRWDGVTLKINPVTGKEVPDENAKESQFTYVNPRKAVWPEADYIVGNPPFIGPGAMRRALGDGYVDAVRSTWKEVPDSADFVMYWWHHSAELARAGEIRRFGFITTNSIKQTFNRRVLEAHLGAKNPLNLAFAIPDHPWVDSSDGAAVRIAMTVGHTGTGQGELGIVQAEQATGTGESEIDLVRKQATISPDLTVGANVGQAEGLLANSELSNRGVCLFGSGFIVDQNVADRLRSTIKSPELSNRVIRRYLNGSDVMGVSRNVLVIDLFGLAAEEARDLAPGVYQHVLEHVKPERDLNKREVRRKNWWLFGETNPKLRKQLAGLKRFIATAETSKHRLFVFLDGEILPDNKLVNIALSEGHAFGVLSSRIHVLWSLVTGSRLGVGNDPVYVKTRCFETFPFPELDATQKQEIGELAERIDAHRKRQQALHPKLKLTDLYNVLEKLRSGEVLSAKEREVNEQGLVSVLAELHDALDTAVFHAYGYDDLASVLVRRPGATTPLLDKSEEQALAEEELLQRLVTLNAERAQEEKEGRVRWLRPELQAPSEVEMPVEQQGSLIDDDEEAVAAPAVQAPWPKTVHEQIAAVRQAIALYDLTSLEAINAHFKGTSKTKRAAVEQAVRSLEAIGLLPFQMKGAA